MYKSNIFLKNYKDNDKKIIISFFDKLDKMIDFNKKDQIKINKDFEFFFLYYPDKKKSIDDLIKLINLKQIKKRYQKSNQWYSLDTSSKIYPLSMGEEWMSVYRLSYYLKDDVNPFVLRIALFLTIPRFPLFKTSIHKGFFWNYLDNINKHYDVEEEKNIPCSYINLQKMSNELFRVIYYQKRISCEFFHVLADANGGEIFLTSLVNEYLRLLGKKVDYNRYALKLEDYALKEECEDAFQNIKLDVQKGELINKKALQIDGKKSIVSPCQIIHFDLDFKKFHEFAKEKNVTINELLLGYLFIVLSCSTSKDGDIKIQVPVNMRKYYPSNTLRNFSLYNTISLKKKEIVDLDSILPEIKKQSRDKLSYEAMKGVWYQAVNLVNKVSFMPLFIKRPITKFIYRMFSDKGSTTVLSNLGKIELPPNMNKEVIKGDFILGTIETNKILFSVVTINEIITLTLSKYTLNSSVENMLYNLFKENNLIKKVHGSDQYEIRK